MAEYTQVYNVINAVTEQSFGKSGLQVVDERSLISLGDYVMSSGKPETWYNTLMLRISETIISTREYKSKFSGLLRRSNEWGAVLQKISVHMPSAEEDDSYGLINNDTVDMYKVNKLEVDQKLFYKSAPYQFHITIYREEQLKKAFTSIAEMDRFISAQFTAVQNKFESIIENLGRNCINNYVAEVNGTTREVKLVTLYNTAKGLQGDAMVKAENAVYNDDFLRFCISQFQNYSEGFTDMSLLYNDGSIERHTPKEFQRMYMLTQFNTAIATNTLYSAFNDKYLKFINPQLVNFWQSKKPGEEKTIKVIKASASDTTETTVNNVVGVLFDYEALGTYREDRWISTTPFNSAGGYANTYWHYNKGYFNDLSENFIVFTLN